MLTLERIHELQARQSVQARQFYAKVNMCACLPTPYGVVVHSVSSWLMTSPSRPTCVPGQRCHYIPYVFQSYFPIPTRVHVGTDHRVL